MQPLNRRRDAWLWRLIATAACFVVFGLGGVILCGVLVPLLFVLPGDEACRLPVLHE